MPELQDVLIHADVLACGCNEYAPLVEVEDERAEDEHDLQAVYLLCDVAPQWRVEEGIGVGKV